VSGSVSYPNYIHYRNQTDLFGGVAAFNTGMTTIGLRTGADAEQATGLLVSGNYFEVLGVRPHVGQFFSIADERVGGPDMVVISHRLWVSRFGEDHELAGTSIVVNGRQVPVVGVAPENSNGADIRRIDVWIP
jgi:hypothetical protein